MPRRVSPSQKPLPDPARRAQTPRGSRLRWQKTTVQFAIKRHTISAQDSGHPRHTSDHAKLDGIDNPG
jgi:hypothetical protein